jgi:DNA invertase Pin-like site-specific DNA recombinase
MSTGTTGKAAVYLRVSLDATGEQLAVQRQREDCEALASQRGWDIIGEYVDNSISASDSRKQRPGYDALVRDFEAGLFDVLICWDLDRLTRQPRQLEDWIDAATERGLVLVTANGEADLSTDAGRLFARIKSSVARAEIERKGARQRRAAQQRAHNGRPPKGARLTGYTVDGEIIPAEADVIRQLFALFAAGESLRALTRLMQESGVPTRFGAPWSPSTVRTLLLNARYAGRVIYQGQTIDAEANWEPIIDADLFDVVQAKMHDPRRKTNRVGTDRKYLGSGIYTCECGLPVRSFSGYRYRCKDGCCSRSGHVVDDFVTRVIEARLSQPDVLDLLAVESNPSPDLLAEAQRLRNRLDTIGADYDAGLIDGHRYRVATEKVNAELTDVQRRIAAASGTSAAAGVLTAADPAEAFRSASLMRQRAVIDALVKVTLFKTPRGRKTFDPDSVRIEWRTA